MLFLARKTEKILSANPPHCWRLTLCLAGIPISIVTASSKLVHIFFTFLFDGKKYYFARNTASSEEVQYCSEGYELTGVVWSKREFTDWLKERYAIDFPGLSFRETVSSFFRIYGKENLDERRPPKGLPGGSMQKSIEVLVKLFNRYGDIEIYNDRLEEQKKKLAAFREARKYRFVPDLVGGKHSTRITSHKSARCRINWIT